MCYVDMTGLYKLQYDETSIWAQAFVHNDILILLLQEISLYFFCVSEDSVLSFPACAIFVRAKNE